jgi:hypothetical protein
MKAVLLAAGLLLAAPALAQAPQASQGQSPMMLYGVTAGPAGVTFRAPMSACRQRGDFTIAVLEREPQALVLLAPRRQGACMPAGVGHLDLTYALTDLGLKPGDSFVLGNPLTPEP